MKRLLFCLIFLVLPGCENSAAAVAGHFENLGNIALANAAHCDEMSAALNDYLDRHGEEISDAVRESDQADPADARRIFNATSRLSILFDQCPEERLISVRRRLADYVLIEAEENR